MLSVQPKPKFVNEVLAKFFGVRVRKYAEIGVKRSFGFFLRDKTFLKFPGRFLQFSKHSFNRSFSDQFVVWKHDIAKKINTLIASKNLNFVRVKSELELLFQKFLYRADKLDQVFSVSGNNHEVIGISRIVLNFQIFLHKLIKLIHISVGEKLGGKVANRHTFSIKEIRLATCKTLNNFVQKPHGFDIFNFSFQNFLENRVVYAVKEFPDIAFEYITMSSVISRDFSNNTLNRNYAFDIAFANSTGKRAGNKCWLKNRVKNVIYAVMQNSVPNGGFVNVPSFGIVDIKIGIWTMFVSLIRQISLKLKDVWFQPFFKLQNVWLSAFANLELLPRQKEVFQVAYFIK